MFVFGSLMLLSQSGCSLILCSSFKQKWLEYLLDYFSFFRIMFCHDWHIDRQTDRHVLVDLVFVRSFFDGSQSEYSKYSLNLGFFLNLWIGSTFDISSPFSNSGQSSCSRSLGGG